MVSAMTVAQLRVILDQTFTSLWNNGGLPHEALDSIDKLVDSAVEALTKASQDDDLDLADGPLDVISAVLRGRYVTDASARDDTAVEIYEALIDAGHLPGVNAQRHSSDSLDSEELVL